MNEGAINMSVQREQFADEVASHYNQVEQKSRHERSKSVIIDLRRFNNAMKSMMHHMAFKFALHTITKRELYKVLDLGCGKGGDLPKYLRNEKVSIVVGVDIAQVSIEQCKERYNLMRQTNSKCFKGEFFVADLTREDISDKLKELESWNTLEREKLENKISRDYQKFHVASTQFSLHYSFESYEQAVRYISNASNNLMRHGIFIGTYPDGPKLLKLARESPTPGLYEVEDIMSVRFAPEDLKYPKPFGTKYHFKLKEVVDCPEFLVHPEVLRRLLVKLGFYEVYDRSFEENLKEAIANPNDGEIVKNIFRDHSALKFDSESKKARLDENMWRAASVYRCFCYKKIRND